MTANPKPTLRCTHCHQSILNEIEIIKDDKLIFCCHGCETVYHILNSNNLNQFYDIRNSELRVSPRVNQSERDFSSLDSIYQKAQAQNKCHIELKVEGIHCMACLWLLEKSPEIIDGLDLARINLEKETIHLCLDNSKKVSHIAEEFSKLGYTLRAIDTDNYKRGNGSNRSEILRIGIAGAALGNIMIYAVSNYAGADGHYLKLFNYISLILSIPIVFYCSTPFYRSSINALRLKRLSIDLPLSIAIVLGFFLSLYNQIIMASEHLYYDSISALVFLILLSRYLVRVFTSKALNSDYTDFDKSHQIVTTLKDGLIIKKKAMDITKGEQVKQLKGETLLFDGILNSQLIQLDKSVITGESIPIESKRGEEVYAGSILKSESIEYIVNKEIHDSRLSTLVKEINLLSNSKTKTVLLADKISQYFIYAVLTLTIFIFMYTYNMHNLQVALNTALAIIIVSCPCALALATPLAFVRSLKKLQQRDIFIKNEDTLEKCSSIKSIILDKTGTLTKGKFELIYQSPHDKFYDQVCYELERQSAHPIARSLRSELKKNLDISSTITLQNFKEVKSKGVSAYIENHYYFLGVLKNEDINQEYQEYTQIGLYKDHQLVSLYVLGDQIKDQAPELISELKEDYNIFISSGDREEVVKSIAKKLSINKENTYSHQSPEDKSAFVKTRENPLMIGDGINDSLALGNADIGVCIGGAVDIALKASDVYLPKARLDSISYLLLISKETKSVIKRNIIFSLSYNLIGITLAITGFITPLYAAILMPLSSLSVIASTIIGSPWLVKQKILKASDKGEIS